jgi:hypothetical protein
MKDFLKFLEGVKGTCYYYNGSGFDNFLHLEGMVKHGYYINPQNFIKANSRIIAFDHSAQLKIRDLFLFIGCSLDRACKDYNVPAEYIKGKFDHGKV